LQILGFFLTWFAGLLTLSQKSFDRELRNVYQVTGVLAVVSVQKKRKSQSKREKKIDIVFTVLARCSIPVSKVTLVQR
jgi:hypothetical protein